MLVCFPLQGESEESLYANNEQGPGGFFPVGANTFWHGGVHLRSKKPVVAVMPGTLVAYRINKTWLTTKSDGTERAYSSGFALLRHEVRTPLGHEAVFYSLSMHLLPWQAYKDDPALVPPRHLSKDYPRVIAECDGGGVNVWTDPPTAAESSHVAGVAPRGAVVTIVKDAKPGPHWKKGAGFVKISWNKLEGFAHLDETNSRKGKGATRVITGDDDKPSVLGIAVHEKDDAKSAVIKILPKNTRTEFKDSDKWKRLDGHYHALKDGGFVFVDEKTIELESVLLEKEPKFDEVVVPGTRTVIKMGDVLGHPGVFLKPTEAGKPPPLKPAPENVVHFELFSTDTKIRENTKNEHWFTRRYRVSPGATFKQRRAAEGAMPEKIKVDLPAGTKLFVSWQNPGSRYARCFRHVVEGWKKTSELGEYRSGGRTIQDSEISHLLKALPGCWCEEETGTKVMVGAKENDFLEQVDDPTIAAREKGVTEEFRKVRFTPAGKKKGIEGWAKLHELGERDPKAPKTFVLKKPLADLLERAPASWAELEKKEKHDGYIKRRSINAPEKAVLEDFEQSQTLSETYWHVKIKTADGKTAMGWRRKSALSEHSREIEEDHFRLEKDLSSLLVSPPKPGEPEKELKITAKKGDALTKVGDKGGFSKVRVIVTEDDERCHGWYPVGHLENPPKNELVLTNALTEISAEDPDSAFTVDAGVNQKVVNFTAPCFVNADSEPQANPTPSILTTNGHLWCEVEYAPGKSGWIDVHAELDAQGKLIFANSRVKGISAYDWEGGWQDFEEKASSKGQSFSEDGLCDVPTLIDLLDKDEHEKPWPDGVKDGVIVIPEIRAALKVEAVKTKLRSVVCLHPSEWDSGGDWDKRLGRIKSAPWHISEASYKAILEYAKKLEFWKKAFEKSQTPPSSAKVWHWHPIATLAHFKKIQGITADQLKEIYFPIKDDLIEKYLGSLNIAMERYAIDTPLRQAHFLAQLGHETGKFKRTREGVSGEVYNSRFDLGNIRPGDGPRFKGHGLIQVTGRHNHSLYGAYVGQDLTAHPLLIADVPHLACDASGWFWWKHHLNKFADRDTEQDVTAITRIINGKSLNGLKERQDLFRIAKRVLIDDHKKTSSKSGF